MNPFQQDLDALRQKLLDLSLNNRLLNYRHFRNRSVAIVDELPAEVYDRLVLNERNMYFTQGEQKEPEPDSETDEPTSIWHMPEPDTGASDRHVDRFLQTELTSEALQKTLFNVHKEAVSVLEEQGYTVLFLALGFLEWYDENTPDKPRKAPLILLPVDLTRPSVGAQFRINWTGEDPLGNISLQARLRDANVEIPDFEIGETKDDVDRYLNQTSKAIERKSNWRVLNSIELGFFSFTKFVMYKDIDPENLAGRCDDSPILRTVFEGVQQSPCEPEPDERRMLVVDADPSQGEVIDAVASGRHVLVEGPPGTGKSQTILNVIGRLLNEGKTVLFVSEKMAALEVVKRRLDGVGLGTFCLELHSRKASRREVLRQVDATLRMPPPSIPVAKPHFEKLTRLTHELDVYVNDLHTHFGKVDASPYAMIGEVEASIRHFEKEEKRIPSVTFIDPDEVTLDQFQEACDILGELAVMFDAVAPITRHPWFGCNPTTLFEDDRMELADQIEEYLRCLQELRIVAGEAAEFLRSDRALTLDAVRKFQSAMELMPLHEALPIEQLTETGWDGENKKAAALISQLQTFQRQRDKVLELFDAQAMELDATTVVADVDRHSNSLFRFVMPGYYRLRRTLRDIYHEKPPGYKRVKADLALLQAGQVSRNNMRETADKMGHLFGDHWRGDDSDPAELTRHMGWIIEVRQLAGSETLSRRSLEMMANGVDKDACRSHFTALSKALDMVNESFGEIEKLLKPDDAKIHGTRVGEVSLDDLGKPMKRWLKHMDDLPEWVDFSAHVNRCRYSAALPMLEILELDGMHSEDLLPAFKGRFYGTLLKQAIGVRQALNDFNADLHEKRIEQFQDADEQSIVLNRMALAAELYSRLPDLTGSSPNSVAGTLTGQMNRKRGHMPIRQLFRHCGPIIQRITPCFMMSPLSVAQFLQPGEMTFDVVIFDEASQVRPEEAVGAFLRADQLVVMGDSKQLPPTSFFDRLADDEDFEGEPASAGMESLLTMCRGKLVERPLQWHYRSRHHSLIAVSNHNSYDDTLLVFPSPFERHDFLGLFMKLLTDTVYDRGKTRMNRGEARVVVDDVFEHFRNHPDKSLGVATFSVSQRVAIEQEMELRLQAEPEMERYFDKSGAEPFFVKNLETVQGDERDVILISVGYGRDADGKLTHNFGPLNQEGGERRLNVLITRAKERCVVYANFCADDLAVDDNSTSRGLSYFKTFLEYAQHRRIAGQETNSPPPPRSLERFVSDDLKALGRTVRNGVGCKLFNLDVALATDADASEFTAGIEFDGPQYSRARNARERDRLRPSVLKGMGWHLERIWSIDWFKSRKKTAKKLLASIDLSPPVKKPTEHIPECKPMPARTRDPFKGWVVDYKTLDDWEGVHSAGELTSATTEVLCDVLREVVKVEGPIHRDEATRRVRELWGLKQTGSKIRETIHAAIDAAPSSAFVVEGDFLLSPNGRKLKIRRRKQSNFDWDHVIFAEIEQGVRAVLSKQYATPEDELIREVCYLFGAKRLSDESRARIQCVIGAMKADDRLVTAYGDRLQIGQSE